MGRGRLAVGMGIGSHSKSPLLHFRVAPSSLCPISPARAQSVSHLGDTGKAVGVAEPCSVCTLGIHLAFL